mmetsp:Transcript_30627/g.70689  ORF Transcript_30627/g.70689 Transcript_30627/m.70689 type:complete len:260 (+) Transcript_30627:392-1171(+)
MSWNRRLRTSSEAAWSIACFLLRSRKWQSARASSKSSQWARQPRAAACIRGVSWVMGSASTVAPARSSSSRHCILSALRPEPFAARRRGVAPLPSRSSTSAPSLSQARTMSGKANSAARCKEWRPPDLIRSSAHSCWFRATAASRGVPPCFTGRAFWLAHGSALGRPEPSKRSRDRAWALPRAADSCRSWSAPAQVRTAPDFRRSSAAPRQPFLTATVRGLPSGVAAFTVSGRERTAAQTRSRLISLPSSGLTRSCAIK